MADIELNMFVARVLVTNNGAGEIDSLAAELGLELARIRESPSFLVGEVDALVHMLLERRERLGVARLAGC